MPGTMHILRKVLSIQLMKQTLLQCLRAIVHYNHNKRNNHNHHHHINDNDHRDHWSFWAC